LEASLHLPGSVVRRIQGFKTGGSITEAWTPARKRSLLQKTLEERSRQSEWVLGWMKQKQEARLLQERNNRETTGRFGTQGEAACSFPSGPVSKESEGKEKLCYLQLCFL
jgi:hypothetical protein